jgi:hypothetical protein
MEEEEIEQDAMNQKANGINSVICIKCKNPTIHDNG